MSTQPNQIEDEDEFELEIIDDTPEPDRDKARRPDGAEPELPEEDEIASYSESVQKRIKKLKYEFHEERRSKEEAARLRDEAISFAQREYEEKLRLQRMLEEGEGVLVNQARQRLTMQLEKVKSEFKAAYEMGDADAMADAQSKMSELKNEEYRLSSYKPPSRQPQQQAPAPQPQKPSVPPPTPRAQDWAKRNEWFMRNGDEDITALAIGTHEKLVRSGVAPDTDQYYAQIDSAVRRAFPERFADASEEVKPQRRQAGNVVAPAGRASGQTPRKVVLTSSQVALAKRLGLSNQQYAAQLMKDASNV
ncbi:hypothetical protein UFOVP858_41 [uncultured Caudovirales phage]|jgi:hypothetical protein|uniref:Uncharacterized protein n=1 Tax=uncultured Caudovirales phage TaxID=2100421 RepID=A0A6J5P8M9_9CAUD|nr:hypothetical protein UFOVP858_41 [uncultured Caudovirales phage]